jgi:hypothetical protein
MIRSVKYAERVGSMLCCAGCAWVVKDEVISVEYAREAAAPCDGHYRGDLRLSDLLA